MVPAVSASGRGPPEQHRGPLVHHHHGYSTKTYRGVDYMKILVFGGRHFDNYEFVASILDRFEPTHIVHGAASGADTLSGRYAHLNRIPCTPYPAHWKRKDPRTGRIYIDRGAGTKRNKRMLADSKPDLLIGFPGNTGTAHMRDYAAAQGYKVYTFDPSTPHGSQQNPLEAERQPS